MRRMRIAPLAVFVTLFLTWLLVTPAGAQQSLGVAMPPPPTTGAAVIGTIVEEGRPVPDASVQLRNAASGRVVARTVAGETGSFRFNAVAPGTYVVEQVDASDRVIAYGELFDLSAGQPLVTVFETSAPPAAEATRSSTGRRRARRSLWITAAAAVSGVIVFGLSGR